MSLKKLVQKPVGRVLVLHESGITSDIIEAIESTFEKSKDQTKTLALALKGQNDIQTLNQVFNFVKQNVNYLLDPAGTQYIPTPARSLHSGKSDCKGFSILINSILHNAGFESGFRFAGYSENGKVSHVYNFVRLGGKTVILDACMDKIFTEKPYKIIIDKMTKIIEISGIGYQMSRIAGNEVFIGLELMSERVQLEKEIASDINGIGSAEATAYDESISDYAAAVGALTCANHNAVFKITDAIGRRSKASKNQRKNNRRERRKRFIKKAGNALKSVKNAGQKIIATPLRLAIRAILPKIAPIFLYLFITDPKAIQSLPAKAQRKRKKAVLLSKFIVNGLKMKESTFMSVTRNGIMKKYKRTPEQILSVHLAKVSGISALPLLAIEPILKLLDQLFSLIKKKPSGEDSFSENDAPDPENDFSEMTTKERRIVRTAVVRKTATNRGEEPNTVLEEAEEQESASNAVEEASNEDESTDLHEPLPGGENFNDPKLQRTKSTGGGSFNFGNEETPETDNSKMLLPLGLAAAAFLAFK